MLLRYLLPLVAAASLAACAGDPARAPSAPPASIQPDAAATGDRPELGAHQRRRAAVGACHGYAEAQVARDARIETESQAAFEAYPSGFGLAGLQGRMNAFARANRRSTLFAECMAAKGYARR